MAITLATLPGGVAQADEPIVASATATLTVLSGTVQRVPVGASQPEFAEDGANLQASDPRFNANAESLLARDLSNVCRYFARWGVSAEPYALAYDLWDRFIRGQL